MATQYQDMSYSNVDPRQFGHPGTAGGLHGGVQPGAGHTGYGPSGNTGNFGGQNQNVGGHGYSYDNRGANVDPSYGNNAQGGDVSGQVGRFFDDLKTIDQHKGDFETYMRSLEAELDDQGVGYGNGPSTGYNGNTATGMSANPSTGYGMTGQQQQFIGSNPTPSTGGGVRYGNSNYQGREPYLSHDVARGHMQRDAHFSRQDQYNGSFAGGSSHGARNIPSADGYTGRYTTALPSYGTNPRHTGGYHPINDQWGEYRNHVVPPSLREYSPLKRDLKTGAAGSTLGGGFSSGTGNHLNGTAGVGSAGVAGGNLGNLGNPYTRPFTGGYQGVGTGFAGGNAPRFATGNVYINDGPGGSFLPPKNRGYVNNLYANPYFIENLGGLPDSVSGDLESSLIQHELRPTTGDQNFKRPNLMRSRSVTSIPGSRSGSPTKNNNFSSSGGFKGPGDDVRASNSFRASRRENTPSRKTTLHESQFMRSQMHDRLSGRDFFTEGH